MRQSEIENCFKCWVVQLFSFYIKTALWIRPAKMLTSKCFIVIVITIMIVVVVAVLFGNRGGANFSSDWKNTNSDILTHTAQQRTSEF